MRRVLVILLGLSLTVSISAQNKAFLIGVSHYPDGSGWCQLNAHNDVTLLRELLSPAWDVSSLEDELATYNGIVSFLKKAASEVSPGDTVLVHFSGHGQQMLPTKKSIHDEPDMLDEAIVPYDANIEWSPNYTGQHHLRDNEFGELIDALRDRVGIDGLVIVVLDACHSDSMFKEDETKACTTEGFRGTTDIFGENVTPEDVKKRFLRDTSTIDVNNNSQVLYISACQAESRNAEIIDPNGVGYGSLSYAVANSIKVGGLNDVDAFIDRIVISMDTLVPFQKPGIRASFEYKMPETKQVVTSSIADGDTPPSNKKPFIIAIVTALAVLLLFVWRAKKR